MSVIFEDGPSESEKGSVTWGDYATTFGIGVDQVQSMFAAGGRYIAEKIGDKDAEEYNRLTQRKQRIEMEEGREALTPVARERLEAAVTSPEFYNNIMSGTALKLTMMAPQVIASVAPLMVPGIGAAAATVGAAGLGGGMAAAQTIDEIYGTFDEQTDEELQKKSDLYAGYRTTMSEEDARRKLVDTARGYKPAWIFMLGALTSAFGPEGQIARALKGGSGALGASGKGIIKRTGSGAAEGGISEFVEEGAQGIAGQQAAVEGGLQKTVEWDRVLNEALEGGLLGGVLGGAAGTISRNRSDTGNAGEDTGDIPLIPYSPPTGPDAAQSEAAVAATGRAPAPPSPEGVATEAAAVPPEGAPSPVTPAPEPQPAVEPVAPVAPVAPVTPDVAAPAPVAQPAVAPQAPAEQAAAPVAPASVAAAPVTPEVTQAPGPITPEVVKKKSRKKAAAPVTPVATPAPAPATPAAAPVAAQAPVPEAPRTGPRILPTLDAEGKPVEFVDDRIKQNLTDLEKEEAGLEDAKGKNWGKEVEQRKEYNKNANEILASHPPAKAEGNYTSTKRGEATAARAAIMARAKSLVAEADKRGVRIFDRHQESANEDAQPNAAMVLLTEAKRLTTKKSPVKADYDRFVGRNYDALANERSAMVAERRSEGEQAKAVHDDGLNLEDQTLNPEERVIEAQEDKDDTATITHGSEKEAYEAGAERPKPEVKLPPKASKVIELARRGATEGERTAAEAALDRIKATANEPAYTARADQKGKFKEERKRRKSAFAPGTSEVTASKPKVDTSFGAPKPKLSIGEKGKLVLNTAVKAMQRNPSEPQKKAGNYAKAHLRIGPWNIAIETPKGATRSGTAPNGSKWSVKMPYHYGYIKGTKGFDGDQIDITLGPKAWPGSPHMDTLPVVVIDQKSLTTGEFDEHKAFVGFDDVGQAMDAYHRSFSDGRGPERVLSATVMTQQEFETWRNSRMPAQEPAAVTSEVSNAEISDADMPLADWDFTQYYVSHGRTKQATPASAVRPANLERVKLFGQDGTWYNGAKTTLKDMLDVHNTKQLGGTGLRALLTQRIRKTVGHIPVYIIRAADFAKYGDKVAKAEAFYSGRYNAIYVSAESLTYNTGFGDILVHEGTHALSMHVLNNDPKAANLLEGMLDYAREYWRANGGDQDTALPYYGLADIHEFLSEANSTGEFQQWLAKIEIDPKYRQELERTLGPLKREVKTLWDLFVDVLRRAIGLPANQMSLLEGVLRVGAHVEGEYSRYKGKIERVTKVKPENDYPAGVKHPDDVKPMISAIADHFRNTSMFTPSEGIQDQVGAPWLMKWRTMDQIAQAAKDYFTGNHVRTIANLMEKIRVEALNRLHAIEPFISRMYRAEKQFSNMMHPDGERTWWQEFASFIHDETNADVWADRTLEQNTHLGRDALGGYWGKAQHPELARRYAALPEELKRLRAQGIRYFTKTQNDMSLGIINNRILKVLGFDDPALGQRIFDGEATDADKALLGPAYDLIMDAKELSKIKGPYFPLMRFGDYVVRARYVVAPPSVPAQRIVSAGDDPANPSDVVWEFKGPNARSQAIAYGQAQDGHPTIESVWVDATTGSRFVTDPATGKESRVAPQDANAEQRFRVKVQDQHVEFFATKKEAQRAAGELETDPSIVRGTVKGIEIKRFESGDKQSDMLSHQMDTLVNSLKRREGYRDLSATQKNELIQAINEAGIRYLGSTRIQSRRLPRRYVKGASEDLTRVTYHYAQSSSSYLAKLNNQPRLDEAVKAMDEAVGEDHSKEKSYGRSVIRNEVQRRLQTAQYFEDDTVFNVATRRLLLLSFLDKLISPAYNIINSLQPTMVTMPVLASRHGMGKSFAAMSQAYSDIAAFKVAKKGIKETIRKFTDESPGVDFITDIKSRLRNENERRLIEYLQEVGSIDPEAGFEIAKLVKAMDGPLGKLDKGLGYLEGIGRQMPRAIESINRTVTALAAYRLERAKGATHEKAMEYAQETVNNTQGLYSSTNAAPVFNHPLGKLSLQFKKYGQMMYHLLGQQIGKAIRNERPGDRAQAIKTLSGLMVTHVVLAGTLGLPTEPFKYLLMGMNAMGVVGVSWQDVEDWERRMAVAVLQNKTLAEMVTRGVTRGLPGGFAFDLSSRVGLDSLLTFGEPRTKDEDGAWAYIAKTAAGAPGSLLADFFKGSNSVMHGNVLEGVEKLVPLKFIGDSVKTYRMATEGKKSKTTGKETMGAYSLPEAGLRVMGFTPGREAETFDRQSAFYGQKERYSSQRRELINTWVNAKGGDKTKTWYQIQQWNRGRPTDAKIQMKDLTTAAKRRATEEKAGTTVLGMRRDKRTAHIFQEGEGVYNYR